jgi:hypothetical protein
LSAFLWSAVACSAGAQDRTVSLRTGPETLTELTASVVEGEDGRFYIRDNSDSEVFGVDGQTITTTTADVADAINQQITAALVRPLSRFTRTSDTVGRLELLGERAALPLASRSGSPLIGARLLRKLGDRSFVIQEELDTGGASLSVRRFIVAYTGEGAAVVARTVAELNVGDVEVADDSYIAIMDESTAMYLAERDGKVVVEYLPLDAEIEIEPPADRSTELELPPVPDDDDEAFRNRVRELAPPREGAADLLPPMTRMAVLDNVKEFLDAAWVVSDANFGLDLDDACDIPANVWSRPARLHSMRGRRVKALPYKWGGYMSVEQFLQRAAAGALTGDVCTCRLAAHNYCIVERAAGVDCSGFVSQVWGIAYETTSHLHAVTTTIRWEDLKPGDALNKAGSHVRLFIKFEDDARTQVRVAESAVTCGGVCERVLSASRFDGYKPIRLRNMSD